MGAVLLARLANTVLNSMRIQPLVTYWVDSTTVLYWITNERPWKQYISHRIQEIHKLTDHRKWRHCPGQLNPADLPLRGLSGEDLTCNKIWWNGPSFLQSMESEWPVGRCEESNDAISAELCKVTTEVSFTLLSVANDAKINQLIDCQRFSNYLSLLRTTAFVLRFVQVCYKRSKQNYSNTELSATELNKAKEYWIKSIQGQSFKEEITFLMKANKPMSIRVKQFGLFLDQGILKCYGRINNSTLTENSKCPILLTQRHPFIDLLIKHFHVLVKHSGVSDTLTTLRGKYWILKGRQAVNVWYVLVQSA